MQPWGSQREVEKIKPADRLVRQEHDAGAEPLTAPAAATRLHWVEIEQALWLDTDSGVEDGLIIGTGTTRRAAIDDAITELEDRLLDLHRAKGATDADPAQT